MITNSEIKQIRSLRDKKSRDESGLFVVEGEKMVAEALQSGLDVTNVYRVEEIGEKAMERISLLSTPSPVLALVRKPHYGEISLENRLYLGLDSVRDPGNMGTIIRIADWFGIDTIFASPDTVDIYNPKVVQATMGGIFRCRVIYTDMAGICRKFKSQGMPVYGTFLDGKDIYSSDLGANGLIVMGNESNGIGREVAEEVNARIFIPRGAGSKAESLNVAVATAVTLAEFNRRTLK